MRLATWLLGFGLMGAAGCTAIAGLDGEYTVGDVGGGGVGASGAAGGSTSTSTNSGGDGGSGGAGGGGTGATGGGGSGGGPFVEDCLDGIDNDGNMLVDCADPACQPDYECVALPAVPSGWTGYFILDSSTYPATPQSCADTTQPDVLFSGPGGDAQCSACACGNASGGGCSFPEMGLWTNSNDCNGGADYSLAPGDGNCHAFPIDCGQTCSNDQRVRITAQSAVTGNPSCPPSGGTPTLPPLWTNEHHVCDMPATGGGGCQMGQACVSMGTSFGGACVQQAGAQTCPGEFPKPLTAYDNATDNRACSSCSCNANGLSCTNGNVVVSDDGACMGGTNADITISGNTCTSVRDHMDENAASYRAVAGTLSGTCNTQGGQPTGSVTPSGEVTFCCL